MRHSLYDLVCHGPLRFIVFKPSDFAIINVDASMDFDIENKITLRDTKDRKLDLRLHYVSVIFCVGISAKLTAL